MSAVYTFVVQEINAFEPTAVFTRKYEMAAWLQDHPDLQVLVWRFRDDGLGGVKVLIREDQEE